MGQLARMGLAEQAMALRTGELAQHATPRGRRSLTSGVHWSTGERVRFSDFLEKGLRVFRVFLNIDA